MLPKSSKLMFTMPKSVALLELFDKIKPPTVGKHVTTGQPRANKHHKVPRPTRSTTWEVFSFKAPTFVNDGRGGFMLVEEMFWFPYQNEVRYTLMSHKLHG